MFIYWLCWVFVVAQACPPSQGRSTEAGALNPLTLGTGVAADLAEAGGAGTGVVLSTGQTQVGAASIVLNTITPDRAQSHASTSTVH